MVNIAPLLLGRFFSDHLNRHHIYHTGLLSWKYFKGLFQLFSFKQIIPLHVGEEAAHNQTPASHGLGNFPIHLPILLALMLAGSPIHYFEGRKFT